MQQVDTTHFFDRRHLRQERGDAYGKFQDAGRYILYNSTSFQKRETSAFDWRRSASFILIM